MLPTFDTTNLRRSLRRTQSKKSRKIQQEIVRLRTLAAVRSRLTVTGDVIEFPLIIKPNLFGQLGGNYVQEFLQGIPTAKAWYQIVSNTLHQKIKEGKYTTTDKNWDPVSGIYQPTMNELITGMRPSKRIQNKIQEEAEKTMDRIVQKQYPHMKVKKRDPESHYDFSLWAILYLASENRLAENWGSMPAGKFIFTLPKVPIVYDERFLSEYLTLFDGNQILYHYETVDRGDDAFTQFLFVVEPFGLSPF